MTIAKTLRAHSDYRGRSIAQVAAISAAMVVLLSATDSVRADALSAENCAVLAGSPQERVDTFSLDRINVSEGDSYADGNQEWGAGDNGIAGGYTTCRGFYSGNDKNDKNEVTDGGDARPQGNIGWRDDGLLNFSEFDDLLTGDQTTTDIPGNGAVTDDPGWIRLAEKTGPEANKSVDYETIPALDLDLSKFIQFSLDFDPESEGPVGSWSLKVKEDAVDVGQGNGLAAFDHLAFVVKQANGFAVYDFNFQEFFDNDVIDQSTAYNFYGSFDLTGLPPGEDFSHISLWARDPAARSEVPAPAPVILISMGFLLYRLTSRSNKKAYG